MATVQAIIALIKTLSIKNQQMVISSLNQFKNNCNASKTSKPSRIKKGAKFWYNEKDQLHRTDINTDDQTLPVVIYLDGSKDWWQNDELHRIETDANGQTLPAVIEANGIKKWA